jgi:hypothetical protein
LAARSNGRDCRIKQRAKGRAILLCDFTGGGHYSVRRDD